MKTTKELREYFSKPEFGRRKFDRAWFIGYAKCQLDNKLISKTEYKKFIRWAGINIPIL